MAARKVPSNFDWFSREEDLQPEVDMNELQKDAEDPREDYIEGKNKEIEDQDPDPDDVVESDLAMDPGAATEAYVFKAFGLSAEDVEDVVADLKEDAENAADDGDDDDDDDGVNPDDVAAETDVTVDVDGGDVDVGGDDGDPDIVHNDDESDNTVEINASSDADINIDVETVPDVESPAEVAAAEHLRRLWGMEDGEDFNGGGNDNPDVEIDVATPNNDVNLEFDDKAVTIEPNGGDNDNSDGFDDGGFNDQPDQNQDQNNDFGGAPDQNAAPAGGAPAPQGAQQPQQPGGGFESWSAEEWAW